MKFSKKAKQIGSAITLPLLLGSLLNLTKPQETEAASLNMSWGQVFTYEGGAAISSTDEPNIDYQIYRQEYTIDGEQPPVIGPNIDHTVGIRKTGTSLSIPEDNDQVLWVTTILNGKESKDSNYLSFHYSNGPPDPLDIDGDGYSYEYDCDDNDEFKHTWSTAYHDADGDGYSFSEPELACIGTGALPYGYFASPTLPVDCNDTDPNLHTTMAGFADFDGDGVGVEDFQLLCTGGSLPTGMAVAGGDCNDADSNVYVTSTGYDDLDHDGYGSGARKTYCISATYPPGVVTNDNDCDDSNENVNPAIAEIPYNGLDDDCNIATLDDDLDRDNFLAANDCDDNNASVYPGASEICSDGIDNDCSGSDYACAPEPTTDYDGDGVADVFDCAPEDPTRDRERIYYVDVDGDHYVGGGPQYFCVGNSTLPPTGFGVFNNGNDCNDDIASINPGVEEVCADGIDNDCNNFVDEEELACIQPEPNTEAYASGGGGGGCFIATAAYSDVGGYNAPEVKTLRRFRDEVLLESEIGQVFVDFYYEHGPKAAKWLNEHPQFKPAVRKTLETLLVEPLERKNK
ncbi:hypothetical protein GOV04_00520 [Candidatus Woesearchaeota archaeon]|nr:hypothetical protein [Candidatus Woesearchaeota archaeon]